MEKQFINSKNLAEPKKFGISVESIKKMTSGDPMYVNKSKENDLMKIGCGPTRIELYDNKGYAELLDMMPRIVENGRFADIAVVKSARISYGEVLKSINADDNLIRYLWTNKHTTPFESVIFSIRVRAPIFVARQVFRHRLFSYNEVSYRYQQPKDEFYYPEVRFQDDNNRQMSKNNEDLTDEEKTKLNNAQEKWTDIQQNKSIWNDYKDLVNDCGVAREVARTILPVSIMTEFIMTGNARTWLHFLKLRSAKDAQKEIRDLADAISKVIEPRIPTTFETFMDCEVNNLDLPGSTIKCIAELNIFMYDNCNICSSEARDIMHKHGIKGKRKITEFVKLLHTLEISEIIERIGGDENMKILLENPKH